MPTTVTTSNRTKNPKSADGFAVGQSSSDLVGFWGATPVDQPDAITAALTTAMSITDTAGTPDYSLAAMTSTSPAGWASVQEAISSMYVLKNLLTRVNEIEARLEEAGIIAAN